MCSQGWQRFVDLQLKTCFVTVLVQIEYYFVLSCCFQLELFKEPNMFSLFTFINFLYVVFRSHSLVALFELRRIVNAFYDSALLLRQAARLPHLWQNYF